MNKKTQHLLYNLLTNIFPKIDAVEEKYLKKQQIYYPINEVRILATIDKHRNETASFIAKQACVSNATLSINLYKLETEKLITRTTDTNDKRIIRINLTAKGMKIVKVYQSIIHEMIENFVADLRLGESSILIRTLENVHHYFQNKIDE